MIAVDTNVLVYAIDSSEERKGPIAVALIERAARSNGVILYQALAEFGAVVTRRAAKTSAAYNLDDLTRVWFDTLRVVVPSPAALQLGWSLRAKYQLQYWDAMMLAGCLDVGVDEWYTEDQQSQPVIEGLRIINPFN